MIRKSRYLETLHLPADYSLYKLTLAAIFFILKAPFSCLVPVFSSVSAICDYKIARVMQALWLVKLSSV